MTSSPSGAVVPMQRLGRCVSAPPGAQRPKVITRRDVELAGGIEDRQIPELLEEVRRVRNTEPRRAYWLARWATHLFERRLKEERP